MVSQQKISHLIEKHFPSFYVDEGPTFVSFVKAYYEWMEQDDNVIGKSRNLLNQFDVDQSMDEFVKNFKQKYLLNFPLLAQTDQRTFIKHASDIYRSKGSERAIELLFRLLFNENIQIYYPSIDILRPSDGKWEIPVYLELSEAPKNASFVGGTITGQRSGAVATVSRVAKRTIAGKTIDVAYLSNIAGNFEHGEVVATDGLVEGNPVVVGSLNGVLIDNAGQDFVVGDIVQVLSDATGKQALARVAQTAPATGKINYNLVDGAAGYTLSSTVIISEKVLTVTDFLTPSPYTTSFEQDEEVIQPLATVPFSVANGAFIQGSYVYGIESGTTNVIAAGRILVVSQNTASGTGTLTINTTNVATVSIGNVANASSTGSFVVGERVFQYLSANSNFKKNLGTVLEANSSVVVVDVLLGSVGAGEILIGSNTNCSANAVTVSIVSGAFTNTDISDLVQQYTTNTAVALAITNSVNNMSATAKLVDSNTTHIGLYDVDASKAFIGGQGAWVYGTRTGARYSISSVSVGDVGSFDIGSIVDSEQVILYPDIIDSNNAANVNFLTIQIDGSGIGSNVGFIDTITIQDGGTGYSNSDLVTFTGGSPSVLAAANVVTFANGTVSGFNITNIGAGYDSAPSVSVSGGTGGDFTAVVDPGYGFVKNINGDFTSIIDTCLRKIPTDVGTIGSLTNIDPGSNNTASPFVRIMNYDLSGFGRKHFTINITGNTKPYIIGEDITQQFFDPAVTLILSGMSSNFNSAQRETIQQVRSDGNTVYGELLTSVYNANTSTGTIRVRVADLANTFDLSNTIVGLTSLATATATAKTTNTTIQVAKGRIIAARPTEIDIYRTRFSVSFAANTVVSGSRSGASAQVVSLLEIDDSPIFGTAAVVSAPAQSANGSVVLVDIIDSGFGYTRGEVVRLRMESNPFVATGIAQLYRQGTGEGYWDNTGSFISHDKVIQDSDFYQDFSYQIQSTLSLERYADVVKDTVHVAGTKTFGRVDRSAELPIDIQTEDLEQRNAVLSIVGGNNLQFQPLEEVAQFTGLTKVANGYVESVRASVLVNGANNEFIQGSQVSRPTFFANTSYGEIEEVVCDFQANSTTLYLTNVRGLFESNGQVQTNFDRVQLTYSLLTANGGSPTSFTYPEVVYQSNGSANVGVGNLADANATHLIIKPAIRLLIGSRAGSINPGDTVFQRASSSAPNTVVGVVGLSNTTVVEIIDPRGQFKSGENIFTTTGSNAHVLSVAGKSTDFSKSNTVIIRIANLTDVGFMDGETLTQPATGASGVISTGNTTYVSVNDVSGVFDVINPVVGHTTRVQATVQEINGPFAIIGANSGASAEILVIVNDRVLTTLAVNSSVGAINTLNVANVSGSFTYNSVIVASNSSTNATITTVEIQAY